MSEINSILLKHLDEFAGFVRKRVSDPDLAFDILQDSLLKALKGQEKLVHEEKLISWFYRILQRTIIDLYRRRNVEKKILQQAEEKLEMVADAQTKNDICQCIETLLPALKPEYAEIIRMDLADIEPQKMATQLGITRNNLKIRRHRAREKLYQHLLETCGICARHGCLDCQCQNIKQKTTENENL